MMSTGCRNLLRTMATGLVAATGATAGTILAQTTAVRTSGIQTSGTQPVAALAGAAPKRPLPLVTRIVARYASAAPAD